MFELVVNVQCPEGNSSESDVEEPLPLCPSPAEVSGALDVVASVTVFEDADRTT